MAVTIKTQTEFYACQKDVPRGGCLGDIPFVWSNQTGLNVSMTSLGHVSSHMLVCDPNKQVPLPRYILAQLVSNPGSANVPRIPSYCIYTCYRCVI